MFKKLLLTTVFLLMFLPVQSVLAESDSEKLVKKTFKEYQKALKKEDYKKVWNSYSMSFRSKENYENFIKGFDKDNRDIIRSLKVEEINSTNSNVIMKTKFGGLWGMIAKRKFYFKFILEERKWKINEMYQSSFSRPPRRGYRPEDFASLDETTKSEIEAIQQLCTTFTKSLSIQDFRTAWECLWKNRTPYDNYLKYNYIRGIKKNESKRKNWASNIVLDIKIENNNATVDLGRNKESDYIFILTKEENQWKIKDFLSTDSLDLDEDKLPSFYFEQE